MLNILRHVFYTTLGFTLLEILVAVSIIAIVSTAVYQMHFFSLSQGHQTALETRCLLLAQKKLAEVKTASEDMFSSASGDFGDDFPGFRWEMQVKGIESDIFKAAGKDLKRIDLKVFSDRPSAFYALRAYRFTRTPKGNK
ncbi:MAG: prepilin-type N-terminal cleavage/methylation domain-containing protein [Deltaproteobacteria bacterium]|nr:prepilin-type N-terminal cleavage/methylation domain-containing protein [Deltaproteobacteria bacterium]MBW2041868.1 prepilin-type N-terminal cleavage/methylation domain-containing protein [Deltaproteobacteria bacterium]MBW2132084.1 prepilin-type N-terminal cleavage/methylation domain-containing protein [Deltaproteobacteria bacterium]